MPAIHRCTAILLLAIASTGCDRGKQHAAAPSEEPIVQSHTVYTATVEHFDEHPPLVAGKGVKFAAHATDIRGQFKAVLAGTMVVVALRDGKVVAESAPVQPSRPGIFGPVLTVPTPGKVEIRIRLDAGDLRDDASLGEVMVYANEAEAAKAREEGGEAESTISFLKEQQWKIDFRNEPAAKRSLVETIRVPGRVIAPPGRRAIVAAPAGGLTFEPADGTFPRLGSRVAAGAMVGSIAPVLGGSEGTQLLSIRAELEARGIEIETEIERAKAKLAHAEKLLARAERLQAQGAASERELEDARFDAELAKADLLSAEKLREPYEVVRKAKDAGSAPLAVPLRAPIAGIVVAANATPGEFVEAGKVLFEVLDPSEVWIEGDVPEPDVDHLPPSPRATFVPAHKPGPAPGKAAAFVTLAPSIDAETRSARIVFAAGNPEGALLLGGAIDLVVETAHVEDALCIPESALVDEDGRSVVFVQVEGEAFVRRDVRTGLRSGGYVAILSGLEVGDRVVVEGAYAVRLQSVSTTIPAHGHAH